MRNRYIAARAFGVALLLALAVAPLHAAERTELLVSRGQAAYQAGRVEEARQHFAAAVAADPDDPAAEYGLGLVLAKLGRWDEAEAPLERALARRPDFAAARRALGLVAYHRGETALDKGDNDQAAALFDRAAELDPGFAGRARYQAGVARARAGHTERARTYFQDANRSTDHEARIASGDYLERLAEGGGPAVKRWELRGTAGFQYDSNPSLEPHSVHDHRDEAAFILGAHGRYDLLQHERALVRFDYDFYQSLMPDFQDFDFRAHQIVGTASYAVQRWLWTGIQGGYDHYSLGSHQYLQEPFVLPFATFSEGPRGRTQIFYRHGQTGYLSRPFEDVRSGQTDAAAITQLVNFEGGARYLSFGYQFDRDDPRSAAGNDYASHNNQLHVGGGFPAWWRTNVELVYVYRNANYLHLNSFAGFTRKRDDNEHRFYAGATKSLTEHLNVTLAYRLAADVSNIGLFDYRRNVAYVLFEVTY